MLDFTELICKDLCKLCSVSLLLFSVHLIFYPCNVNVNHLYLEHIFYLQFSFAFGIYFHIAKHSANSYRCVWCMPGRTCRVSIKPFLAGQKQRNLNWGLIAWDKYWKWLNLTFIFVFTIKCVREITTASWLYTLLTGVSFLKKPFPQIHDLAYVVQFSWVFS